MGVGESSNLLKKKKKVNKSQIRKRNHHANRIQIHERLCVHGPALVHVRAIPTQIYFGI